MKCQVCRAGETRPGTATITLERDGLTLVIRNVPARVCENCGEEFVDDAVAQHVSDIADEALRSGVRVDVRDYQVTEKAPV